MHLPLHFNVFWSENAMWRIAKKARNNFGYDYIMFMCTILSVISAISSLLPSATALFVANNGNDFNPGTQAQPFQTIQKTAIYSNI
jgi:hypothetical protein